MNKRSGKLFEQMKEQVIGIILERGLKPHDPIPSEGELASRFGVSRMTGKLALQALQEDGIVYRLPRRGTFLADVEPDELRQLTGARQAGEDSLYGRSGNYIALIVPGIDDYIGKMMTSIEQAAKREGIHMIVKIAKDESAEAEVVRSLSNQNEISGILLFPVDRKICGDHLLRLKLQKYPIVILDRQFNEIDFDSVSHDHYKGAYEMTSYLLGLGHREIGFVTNHVHRVKSREERYQGYLDALMAGKVDIQTDRILFLEEDGKTGEGTDDNPAGKSLLQSYLASNRKLTAVFCSDDYLAMSVMGTALKLGLRVPEELSIAGFSNHSVLEYAPVSMTTVAQPMEQFGEWAVRLLLNRLMNPDARPSTKRLETIGILRDSTTPPVNLQV
ncbi:GntR family transcriptional regulator [Paenibacillus sp. DMB20]|uniref:GntR family transcriptional regulator n=1 Tax=Paenibacillus sp. DMB20 TaxID=1642570 RepID=UPI000627493A|nr:GntR family transcriptional regulator [Paenibacillus sp. DMB20]KKO53654.1 hypothetical protein XI25_11705 [Paenibacillus sp. DMB20]